MTPRIALILSLLVAGSGAAFAQHAGQHPAGQPHDRASHPPMDPEMHALMHGVLGHWTGTLTSPDGSSAKLDLSASDDKHGALMLKMAAARSRQLGAATDVAIDGHTLRWTQAYAGAACKASATVASATAPAADTMKGSMTCADREIAFALEKTK